MVSKRWKLIIEYNGWGYYGWQRQSTLPSIQASVEEAILRFSQQEIEICGAGRTDGGVHAFGQVAHFDLDYGERAITPHEVRKAINAHLRPQPISIREVEKMPEDFHARFSAKNKHYMYRMICRSAPVALDQGKIWHNRNQVDIEAMREGAKAMLGKHNFTSFRDSDCQANSPVRTLDRLDIEEVDYDGQGGVELRFHVEGQSFLHHQVRNMVGTLAYVGQGKFKPEDVKTILESKNRTKAGPTAPADGLYLMRIDY